MARQSSLRRRRVVGALRRMREEAGLTMARVVDLTGFSQSKLSRIENLEIGITGDDTRTLCEAYGVDRKTTEALAELARRGRRRGWWHGYSGEVLGKFEDFVELEADACAVNEFEVDLVPGLLQTERYADAVIRHGDPTATDEVIAARVELRMERQERWHERGFELWSIMDESVLRRPVGGADIMAEQLDHLVKVAAHPKVTVQVLLTGSGGHMALGVPYTVIDLIDKATFIYIETLTGGLFLEDEPDLFRYNVAWGQLSAMALDLDTSVALIDRIAGEHRNGHG